MLAYPSMFLKTITLAVTAITLSWANAAPMVLESFTPESVDQHGWKIVNDGVMGGLSQGFLTTNKDGVLTFKGALSLDNNGGFSSIRTDQLKHDLSAYKGVKIRVRGDDRTYQLRFTTDARYRGREISFKAEFVAAANKWSEITIPFSKFTGSFRGIELPKASFDPAMVRRISLLIADKKAGPFQLEIDWIHTSD